MRSDRVVMLLLVMALGACSELRVQDAQGKRPVALTLCQRGEQVMQRSVLYFGAARTDGGEVTDADWAAFLDRVITPEFPDGLTWFPVRGQWRDGQQSILRETSRMLVLLHDAAPKTRRRIDGIIARYVKEFAQESVLQERTSVCARFHSQ